MKIIGAKLYRIFYILFLISFIWIFANVILNNTAHDYNPIYVISQSSLIIVGLFILYCFLSRYKAFLERRSAVILWCILVLTLIIRIIVGYYLQITPDFDVKALYQGAINWLEHGRLLDYDYYFSSFSNNLGGLAVLHFFFGLSSLVGYKDFNMVGVILSAFCITFSILVIYLVCKRIFSVVEAFMALIIASVSLPLYATVSIFYTDVLSMLSVILPYYLYLIKAKDSKKPYLIYTAIGIICGVGSIIKMTPLIVLIAIVIEMILVNKTPKKILIASLAVLFVTTVITITGFYFYMDNVGVLNQDQVNQNKLPLSHWVMMGLRNDGGYNPQDYDFTRSFNSINEKNNACIKEIGKRLKDLKPQGYSQLMTRKNDVTWGNGEFGTSPMLEDGPLRKNILHKYVLEDGKYYKPYSTLCQSQYVALFILILSSIYYRVKKGETNGMYYQMSPLYIAVFGLLLFTMLWEANSRIILNYLPVFIVCAIPGLKLISNKIGKMHIWNGDPLFVFPPDII